MTFSNRYVVLDYCCSVVGFVLRQTQKVTPMSDNFDLDLSFADQPAEPDLTEVSTEVLAGVVAGLPAALRHVAEGILIEGRTMSDVSQALGIRQSELVTRLHRAKHSIAESLGR